MFVDYVEIEVLAGKGGPGCLSFHTEKFVPMGGPDGGNGGTGADIVAVADPNLTTLMDFRYKRQYKAQNGQPGEGGLRTGKSGEDVRLRLPTGTVIKDIETGDIVCDLDNDGDEFVVARGGRGGKGNHHFKSATNQAPRMVQPGEPGEGRRLSLELKLLADVGLVGQPNAGKSTILAAFSAARPRIADYPFTTLIPNLGIVQFRDYKSCVMADIPGLIEGASHGKGLGHQFLRHIQRTRLLVYVIDVNETDIPGTRRMLEEELTDFDSSLGNRPTLTVVTKIDTLSESDLNDLGQKLPADYIYLSAVARMGAQEFLQSIERELDKQRTQESSD